MAEIIHKLPSDVGGINPGAMPRVGRNEKGVGSENQESHKD
jgi:hypothetical protein